MLHNGMKDDVERMHRLLSRVPDGFLEAMFNCVTEYLRRIGQSIGVRIDIGNASEFVQCIFNVRRLGALKN